MSTTTIRIEEELKARVAVAAERTGLSAHAFIIDAIAQRVDQLDMAEELRQVAEERWTKLMTTGASVPWEDAKAYLQARARGELLPRRPAARKLGR